VHNYIPNWLKLANEGRIFEAAELSHQTNTLPEVCGRARPAGPAPIMATVLPVCFTPDKSGRQPISNALSLICLLPCGIPAFKLEKEVMTRRREIFTGMGIEFRLNTEVGRDVQVRAPFRQSP
jgi:glutamate synthase (NADPH/NADH) small chain